MMFMVPMRLVLDLIEHIKMNSMNQHNEVDEREWEKGCTVIAARERRGPQFRPSLRCGCCKGGMGGRNSGAIISVHQIRVATTSEVRTWNLSVTNSHDRHSRTLKVPKFSIINRMSNVHVTYRGEDGGHRPCSCRGILQL